MYHNIASGCADVVTTAPNSYQLSHRRKNRRSDPPTNHVTATMDAPIPFPMATLPDLPTELLLMALARCERNHLAAATRVCKRLDEVAGALLWKEAFLLDVIAVLSPGHQVVEGTYSICPAHPLDSTALEQGGVRMFRSLDSNSLTSAPVRDTSAGPKASHLVS